MTHLNDLLGAHPDDLEDTVVQDAGNAVPRRDRVDGSDDHDWSGDHDGADDQDPRGGFADNGVDDLFDDDALLAPKRTSRLTIVLVALLILMVGFFAGVQVGRVAGGMPVGAPPSTAASAPTSGG